jgi:hypothetical protein
MCTDCIPMGKLVEDSHKLQHHTLTESYNAGYVDDLVRDNIALAERVRQLEADLEYWQHQP